MLKPPLAVIAITSVLVTLATGAVAQKCSARNSTGHHLLERADQNLAGRQSLRYQRRWHCDLYCDRWTAFEYCECEGCRGAALQSPG